VMASAGGGPSAATAAARASPTPRHPENFRRWTASRAGPRYAKAARAEVIGAGGQSRHRSTSVAAGLPHRRHHGGSRGTRPRLHDSQNGHGPAPHPAQARGNRMSTTRSSAISRIACTLERAADTGQGRTTSTGPAPLIEIVTVAWVFKMG
jgi:hypothetical protein